MLEAFQVAVELKLIDHFSAVFEGFSKRLVETSKHADELQKKFESIGTTAKIGMAMTSGGFGLLGALKASTQEAQRYEQQLNRLKALNLGNATTKSLQDKATEISNTVKGTSDTDALALVTQTRVATGNEEQTKMLVPVLAQMRFGLETYMASHGGGEGKGEEAENQFQAIVKVMETRGLMHDMTSEKIDRMADLFTKSFVATGGTVQPSEFLEMMKSGGLGTRAMSDDFMIAMGRIMHEKGGADAGAGMMAAYRNLATSKMPPQVADMLNKLGLLQESSIHRTGGTIDSVDTGGMDGADLLASRPDLFLQEKILPALAKKFGVDTNDQNAVLRQLGSMSGKDSSSDLFAQLYMERDQLKAYIAQGNNAMGYKELNKQEGESTTGQEIDLRAQIAKLEKAFGDAALPVLKSALEQVIPMVKELGEWLKEHPDGLSMLVKTLAGLGFAMMVIGPLVQIGSGLRLLSMGASALSGPLGKLGFALAMNGAVQAEELTATAGGIGQVAGKLKMLSGESLAKLAGNLGSVGGQLKMLGSAAAVFAAYEAGHWVGTQIYENLSPEHREQAGGTVATILSWLGSTEAKEAIDATMKANSALSPNEISRLAAERAKKQTAMHATPPPHAAPAASATPSEDKHAAAGGKAAQQKPSAINNYLTVLLDGREIAARLIPHASMGTGDYNLADSRPHPSMSNFAIP